MAAAPTINYSDLLRNLPAGAWVAISERLNKVVAYGAEVRAVLDDARAQGEHDPLIVRVPEQAGMLFL